MKGWIADSFRTAWGFVYWNLRKSLFRARRGRGRCPCQNPSDSGRAWETGCEAALNFNRTARFRRVCPLLKPAPDGSLKCSVNASEVRPFWGRAIGFYAGSAVATYGVMVLLAFGVLRGIGYKVTPWTLAWPPEWSSLRVIRSQYFLDKARAAYGQQRVNEAILSLSLAYEIDPRNHAAGLLLAQMWQVGQVTLSDRIYVRLMREHPTERTATAQHWYRALLARGDFETIAQLSADALHFDAEHSPAWLHALTFATRRTGNASGVDSALATPEGLTPEARVILDWERLCLTNSPPAAIAALQQSVVDPTTPYSAYYRITRLVSLGAVKEAASLFERTGARLGERERVSTQLDLYAALGWEPARRTMIEALLRQPGNLPTIEILAAHLIRRPSPELATLLFSRQTENPLPGVPDNYAGYTALFCTAAVYGNEARTHEYAAAMKRISGAEFLSLDAAGIFFRQAEHERRIEAVIPVLQPLPLEVTYALLERFYRPRPAPVQP